jgi:preprotein translocase subunit SecG
MRIELLLLVFSSVTVVSLTVFVFLQDNRLSKEINGLRKELDVLRVEHRLTRMMVNENADNG